MGASIRPTFLESQKIHLPFIHPPIIQHEWILPHARCKGITFKAHPYKSHRLAKNTHQKPIRKTANHDGAAGIPSDSKPPRGGGSPLSACLLLSALKQSSIQLRQMPFTGWCPLGFTREYFRARLLRWASKENRAALQSVPKILK